MLERFHAWKGTTWQRFIVLAQGPHALFWLAVCALTDPIFFPIPPEAYLVALILAHRARIKIYLIYAIIFSCMGAMLGYVVGGFLFHQFGMPLLHFYHLEGAFVQAQELIKGGVFIGMILVAFQLIPEKVFVLAAGFLGAPFLPFIAGFFVGRALRLVLIGYLTNRFGSDVLTLIKRYLLFFTVLLMLIIAYYVIVRFHPLPL
jgi:membrane protein YqaA with SNARE-associated domain